MKLVSRADLARLAGVSRAAVTQQCKKRLADAVQGARVDLSHPEVQAWLASLRGSDPNSETGPDQQLEPDRSLTTDGVSSGEPAAQPPRGGPEGADFGVYADMTLRQLTEKFGTARAFSDWLDGMNKLEQIRTRRLANEETQGQLIDRDMVQTHVFGTLDGMCRRLLTDASKTITRRLDAASNAGETIEARELITQEIIGSIIEPAKDQVIEALRND